MSEISELQAMQTLDDLLSKLEPGTKKRVIDWIYAKHVGEVPTEQHLPTPPSKAKAKSKKKPKAKPKSGKKPKSVLKKIKELDFHLAGKNSFSDFVAEKRPTNHKQKSVVALYYFLNTMEVKAVSTNHIYSAFKDAGWVLPSDLVNQLHQAGSEGWLDSANAEDIKLMPKGENLIEHHLPKKGKK